MVSLIRLSTLGLMRSNLYRTSIIVLVFYQWSINEWFRAGSEQLENEKAQSYQGQVFK